MNTTMMNLTCEENRYIGKTAVDPNTEDVLRYLLVSYLLLLFPFATLLNLFLIILTATIKSLHKMAHLLTLQLVVVDLGLTIIVTPITVASAIAGKWVMGPMFCSFSIFVIHLIRHARYGLMFVFVSDRFATVFFPFSYQRNQKKFVTILSIAVWVIAFVFAVLPVALDCEVFSRLTFYCTGGNGCTNKYTCQTSRLVTVTVTNVMGSLTPLILYVVLFVKAKKIQKTINVVAMSDKERQNRKFNSRTNATYFWLFLALFGVSILPFLFFIIGNSILQTLSIRPPPQYQITTNVLRSLYNILPLIDPIAIMRNAEIREAIILFKKKILSKQRS